MFKLRHENCSHTIISNKTKVEINNYPDPLGFRSNASCLNTLESVMIFGFIGLLATLPSLVYFLRLSLREMQLVKYRIAEGKEEPVRYLSNEPLSENFVHFMKRENPAWVSTENVFGTPDTPDPVMTGEIRSAIIEVEIQSEDFSPIVNTIHQSKKRISKSVI